jgi:hypothetical protein
LNYAIIKSKLRLALFLFKKDFSMTEFDRYIENAVRWALAQLDSTDYLFRCLAFVEDAYEQSNQVEIFGSDTAKGSADEYEAFRNVAFPPKGAFVFYDCWGIINGMHRNWGHVGLTIDENEGKIIHAWDRVRIDSYLDIEELKTGPGWTKPKYIGWAPVERIFQGYRKK